MKGSERPTLEELRARVQKDRHREIGNWMARRWARPAAVYGTWVAVRLGMSAHQVTALAAAVGLAGAVGIGTGTRWGFVAGVVAIFASFWLDRVDGQVARWRGTANLDGVYLDYLMHHALGMAVGFAMGFGLAMNTGQVGWSVAGFGMGAGWAVLGLHNDCRYKAFFQRLKRPGSVYVVRGGSAERPGPAPGWPGTWPGVVSWPLSKACEMHVVMVGLAGLAGLAVVSPSWWLMVWKGMAVGMSVVAVLMGGARVWRSARRGGVEEEFGRWFGEERGGLSKRVG